MQGPGVQERIWNSVADSPRVLHLAKAAELCSSKTPKTSLPRLAPPLSKWVRPRVDSTSMVLGSSRCVETRQELAALLTILNEHSNRP